MECKGWQGLTNTRNTTRLPNSNTLQPRNVKGKIGRPHLSSKKTRVHNSKRYMAVNQTPWEPSRSTRVHSGIDPLPYFSTPSLVSLGPRQASADFILSTQGVNVERSIASMIRFTAAFRSLGHLAERWRVSTLRRWEEMGGTWAKRVSSKVLVDQVGVDWPILACLEFLIYSHHTH